MEAYSFVGLGYKFRQKTLIIKYLTMTIPKDPFMLMSMINMKLRDGDYDSLSDLCLSLDIDEKELISKLKETGFEYMPEIRQFR